MVVAKICKIYISRVGFNMVGDVHFVLCIVLNNVLSRLTLFGWCFKNLRADLDDPPSGFTSIHLPDIAVCT